MKRLVCALVGLMLGACVMPPDGSQQPQYGGQGAPPPQQQQPQATALNCTQLFGCFGGCAADGACIQACLAAADPTSQATASALIQCGSSKCQNEQQCVQSQCQAEVQACGANQVAQAAPQPTYPEAAPQPTYPEPAPAAPAQAAVSEMHASDLVREFETNEIRANQQFIGQRVRIHGTVNTIEIGKDGRLVLTYKSSISTYNNARCYFDPSQSSRVATLSANQQATVEGTVRGWEGGFLGAKVFVQLTDCVVP